MRRIFTATEKLEAIIRELEYRRHVYPRLCAANKMHQVEADRQIALFEAIAEDYQERLP